MDESMDGESMSCDADDITSNMDLVELGPRAPDVSGPQTSGTALRDDDLGSLSSGSSCHRSSRELRNLAEKKRRDTLNTHINELSVLVPMVASSSKKMDKTSVLRLSATYIRMSKTLIPDKNWPHLAAFLDSINLSRSLMEHLEGFLMIVTAAGRVIFVSHTIEEHLGHSQNDLMGQDLYSIVHEDDRDELKRNLTPDGGFPCCPGSDGHDGEDSSSSESVTSCSSGQSSPGPPPDVPSSTSDRLRDAPLERQRRSFYLRMSPKGSSRADQREFEHVHIIGVLRVPARLEVNIPPPRTRRTKDCRYNENDIILIAMGRLYKGRSVSDLSLLEATKEEYITRHEPSGRMIYSDHRVSVVAGYMSEEVIGKSAFNFIHPDDISWTMIALKKMYDSGEGFGGSTYRLRAKNGTYVYLRTSGYLEFDQNTQAIESFICVNTLITEEEGEKGIEEMKRRYSPHFLEVQKSLPLDSNDIDFSIEKIYERIVTPHNGDDVSSSTEIATRPTVLREVTSVHRVSSSSGERVAVKRIIEESPRPQRKLRRHSPIDLDVNTPSRSQDLLDLDLSVQNITHASQVSPYRTVSWKKELSSGIDGRSNIQTKRDLPAQTVKAPKNSKALIKTTTQVQQEMEHILSKSKRGMSNVSV